MDLLIEKKISSYKDDKKKVYSLLQVVYFT